MKYQQGSIIRLSAAGRRLVNDGEWHAFASGGNRWYRVKNRVVQRITITEPADETWFELLREVEPLHPRLFREGFREELTIRRCGEGFAVAGILMRAFPLWEEIARRLASDGVSLDQKGASLLEASVWFPACTRDALSDALLTMKAFLAVAGEWPVEFPSEFSAGAGPFIEAYRLAREVVRESLAPAAKKKRSAEPRGKWPLQ